MKHIWLFNIFAVWFLSIVITIKVARGEYWWLWVNVLLIALNALAAYVGYRRAKS